MPRPRCFRPHLETLESREVPAGLGRVLDDLGPIAVTSGYQAGANTLPPSVALDGNGSRFVTAWTDVVSSEGQWKAVVRAQVLAADGSPLTGVITVTDSPLPYSTSRPVKVDVGIDTSGRFAVAYDGLPNGIGQADIGLRRYEANGTPVGATRVIGTSNRLDINPSVDLAGDGRIAVAFDQTTGVTHRLNSILYASFDNLDSNSQTSISSTGGEIFPHIAFNAAGQFLLSGTTLSGQARTPLRVFQASGALSASTVIQSPVLVPPALADVPGGNGWRLVYLDTDNGVTRLVVREVMPGVNQSSAPVVGPVTVLLEGVNTDSPPAVAVDAAGNLVVAYSRPAGSGTELAVSFFAPGGALLQTVPLTDTPGSEARALARGATAFDALLIHAAQMETGAVTGTQVDFEIRGALFPIPAPLATPMPTAPALINIPIQLILEESPSGLPTYPPTLPTPVLLSDMMFGRNLSSFDFGETPPSAGEPALSGVTRPFEAVFLDLNGNGRHDAGEPQAVTGADGRYRFDGFLAGDHRVLPMSGATEQEEEGEG